MTKFSSKISKMLGPLMLETAAVLSTLISSTNLNNLKIAPCDKCVSISVDTNNGYCSTIGSTTNTAFSTGSDAIETVRGTVDDLLNTAFGPFTFIIVGGGTSGCVLASRLSENPDHSVLLIEAGTNDTLTTSVPSNTPMSACSNLNYGDYAKYSDNYGQAMNGRLVALLSGRGLGGSSNTNDMIYNRGFREALDEWANVTGFPQYSANNMEKYFFMSESARMYNMDADHHATNGSMPVRNAWYSPLAAMFEQVCRTRSIHVGDYNGEQQVACSRLQYFQNNGARVNTCQAYLNRALRRPNLTVLLNTKVTRIDRTKATGVEFCTGAGVKTVRATKEVIVAAGALRSPQVLLLSGVGNRRDLQQAGIASVSDRNVGYNLFDTNAYGGIIMTSDKTTSTDGDLCYSTSYKLCHDGPSTLPFHYTAIGNMDASTAVLLQEFGPYSSYGPVIDTFNGNRTYAEKWGVGMKMSDIPKASYLLPVLTRPWSRGVVKLDNACPYGRPIIDMKYFSDSRDKERMIYAIRLVISLIRTTSTFRLENAKFYEYPVPGCEDCEWESDAYFECALKYLTLSIGNYGGSNKMGPLSDPDSVVDGNCNVHGVEGLRVVDASVLPFGMGTTQNQAIVIALAELIAEKISKLHSY